MTSGDSKEFWDDVWSEMGGSTGGPDAVLAGEVSGLTPGRALEMGCGMGENAIWLAEQGWQVTAVDFSDKAIGMAKELASERGASVDFVAADASEYEPEGQFDLVTSFYIHLPPELRAKMLANVSRALAPGGVVLFVSHDKSTPPSGWSKDDLLTLTSPDEVASELRGLRIDKAVVVQDEAGAHASEAHGGGDHHEHEGRDHEGHDDHEGHHGHGGGGPSNSTVVRATKLF